MVWTNMIYLLSVWFRLNTARPCTVIFYLQVVCIRAILFHCPDVRCTLSYCALAIHRSILLRLTIRGSGTLAAARQDAISFSLSASNRKFTSTAAWSDWIKKNDRAYSVVNSKISRMTSNSHYHRVIGMCLGTRDDSTVKFSSKFFSDSTWHGQT